jgi:hypothetical protein
MAKNKLMGMEGFREEELRNLLKEVVALRARIGENARTLSAAERLLQVSRTQLMEIKTELCPDMRRNIIGVPEVDAPALSSW